MFPPSVSSLAAVAVLSPFPGQILQTSCSHYLVEILLFAEQVEAMLGPWGSSCTTESLQQRSPDYTLIPDTLICHETASWKDHHKYPGIVSWKSGDLFLKEHPDLMITSSSTYLGKHVEEKHFYCLSIILGGGVRHEANCCWD